MDEMNLEESTRSERMEEWMGYVEGTLEVLERVSNTEIASRNRPWQLYCRFVYFFCLIDS